MKQSSEYSTTYLYLVDYIKDRVQVITYVPQKRFVTVGFVMDHISQLAGAINFALNFKLIDSQEFQGLVAIASNAAEAMLKEAFKWDFSDQEFGKLAADIAVAHFKGDREKHLSVKLSRLWRQKFAEQDHLLESFKELLAGPFYAVADDEDADQRRQDLESLAQTRFPKIGMKFKKPKQRWHDATFEVVDQFGEYTRLLPNDGQGGELWTEEELREAIGEGNLVAVE